MQTDIEDSIKLYGKKIDALLKEIEYIRYILCRDLETNDNLFVYELKLYKNDIEANIEGFNQWLKEQILERESSLIDNFLSLIPSIKVPKIDLIAVTNGPGLEPALWVGINFAKALSFAWNIPVIPVNHMEGHILSVLIPEFKKGENIKLSKINFPAMALLISGGHTELVLIKDWLKYKKIGETRDDATGEAFDKVARMLGLPYPGGPEISKLASIARTENKASLLEIKFPRPMMYSNDFDFSFSGLKTAVLYFIKKIGKLDLNKKIEISKEFEDAVTDVLVFKTINACKKYKIKTLIVGGGVSSNKHIKETLKKQVLGKLEGTSVFFPEKELATDNSLMIAIAGYFQLLKKNKNKTHINSNTNKIKADVIRADVIS